MFQKRRRRQRGRRRSTPSLPWPSWGPSSNASTAAAIVIAVGLACLGMQTVGADQMPPGKEITNYEASSKHKLLVALTGTGSQCLQL
jgi:hypothetical protein